MVVFFRRKGLVSELVENVGVVIFGNDKLVEEGDIVCGMEAIVDVLLVNNS